MSDLLSEPPVLEETLVIQVRRGRWRTRFYKPDKSIYKDQYSISFKRGRTIVVVKWEEKKGIEQLPRCLRFEAEEVISGIGFSECPKCIERYRLKGPCGGCFTLRNDLTGDTKSAYVDNWGHHRENGKGYHFAVWLGGKGERLIEIDPQIYNEGKLPPPIGKQSLFAFLRRLLLRLLPWLS